MAKKDYSKIIANSLQGRSIAVPDNEQPTTEAISSKIETTSTDNEIPKKELPSEEVSSPEADTTSTATKDKSEEKKSNAGRKKMHESKKKKQMVLTLSPATYNKLIEWAETKARTAPNYVSDYVEEHIDDIINN